MVKRTQEEKLRGDALKATRIEQTLATKGWQDIKAIIQAKYDGAMNDLLAKENAEARGAINAIVEIMNDIERDIDFGNAAREQYRKKFLNQTPQGE